MHPLQQRNNIITSKPDTFLSHRYKQSLPWWSRTGSRCTCSGPVPTWRGPRLAWRGARRTRTGTPRTTRSTGCDRGTTASAWAWRAGRGGRRDRPSGSRRCSQRWFSVCWRFHCTTRMRRVTLGDTTNLFCKQKELTTIYYMPSKQDAFWWSPLWCFFNMMVILM